MPGNKTETNIMREGRQYGVDAVSVETDDGFNSEIGDSVDYLDPAWLARSDALVHDLKPGESVAQGTSGSGSITNNEKEVQALTGTTSGSTARIRRQAWLRPRSPDATWNKDRVLRALLNIFNDDNNCTLHLVTGEYNDARVGFKVANGDLLGTVHNGTSETTTTLVSNPGSGRRDCRAEFVAGTDVTFYVDGSKQGTISSGLPSGTAGNPSQPFDVRAENSSSVDRGILTSDITVVQLP